MKFNSLKSMYCLLCTVYNDVLNKAVTTLLHTRKSDKNIARRNTRNYRGLLQCSIHEIIEGCFSARYTKL